jgi:hypothetical protein
MTKYRVIFKDKILFFDSLLDVFQTFSKDFSETSSLCVDEVDFRAEDDYTFVKAIFPRE